MKTKNLFDLWQYGISPNRIVKHQDSFYKIVEHAYGYDTAVIVEVERIDGERARFHTENIETVNFVCSKCKFSTDYTEVNEEWQIMCPKCRMEYKM